MIQRPSKIVCAGRSYAEHAKELGNAVPDRPVLFIKPPSTLINLNEGISWDSHLGSCHYECEFVVRLNQKLTKQTNPLKAIQAIDAVTLGLDLTLRDLQTELKQKGYPWERAKAFDGSCVLGDWIDASEVLDWENVKYTLHINQELRQQGNTADLIFSIGEMLCDMSCAFTLEKGDVVMTGTPAGVNALYVGDHLVMTLQGQSQKFVWETHVKKTS